MTDSPLWFYRDWNVLLKKKSPLHVFFKSPILYFLFFLFFRLIFVWRHQFCPPAWKSRQCYVSFFEKKWIFARPSFAWYQLKKIIASALAPFLGKSNCEKKKKIVRSLHFFSAQNPSSIKLLWCGRALHSRLRTSWSEKKIM